MQHIKKIEIKHFRSINELVIEDLSDINVFSGLNDVGKSNIIKALNLFFNNQVEWNTPLDLERDTSTYHSYFSKHARKRKFISVRLTFNRPAQYSKTLPDVYWVERQWDRQNPLEPQTTWGHNDRQRALSDWPRSLTWFLKKSRFLYVPAVRDRDYLLYLLGQFSLEITESDDPELKAASSELSNLIQSRSSELRAILKSVTGLAFTFELPDSLLSFLRAAGLHTEGNIPLQLRGDGIQGLTVPAILEDLRSRSPSDFFIWGFEEPENSLEYRKSADLAAKMRDRYSTISQVLMTTHSPAFLAMENPKTSIYHVSRRAQRYERKDYEEQVTTLNPVFIRGQFHANALHNELGLVLLARKIGVSYKDFAEKQREIESLRNQLHKLTGPTLIVEGQFDCRIISIAWKRLYRVSCPFNTHVADGESRVSEMIDALTKGVAPKSRRVAALLDHDKAGIGRYNSICDRYKLRRLNDSQFISGGRHMLVMTLNGPILHSRAAQAANQNLCIEHLFDDSFLWEIHEASGCKLFCGNKLIWVGEHQSLDHESVQHLVCTGLKRIEHLALDGKSGAKSLLVDRLSTLDDKDFLAFHDLFRIIVKHLVPDFDLKLKPELQSELET